MVAAKSNGANAFEMGRTEEENSGLLTDLLEISPNHLLCAGRRLATENGQTRLFVMPNSFLTVIGKLVYRHIG